MVQTRVEKFNRAADIKLPGFFKYIIKYVTPVMLITIFIAAFIQPAGGDWSVIWEGGWELDGSSVLGRMLGKGSRETGIYTALARYFLLGLISLSILAIYIAYRRKEKSKNLKTRK